MRRTWFTSGDYNAVCDICGFYRKASQLIERWDGMMCCLPTIKRGCWEIRHPQDLIRPIPDQQALLWTRPDGDDTFVERECPPINIQAIPCLAIPCCMIPCRDYGVREVA